MKTLIQKTAPAGRKQAATRVPAVQPVPQPVPQSVPQPVPQPAVTVGLDLGDRESALCVLDAHGTVLERATISTTRPALERWFSGRERVRVVLEAGTHSPWVSRLLSGAGHEVVVAHPAALYGGAKRSRRKSDRIDAEFLARQGRADVELLHPIRHRSESAQAGLALVQARDALVKSRTLLVNTVRGTCKAFGTRLPKCSAESFHRSAAEHVPQALHSALSPLLETLGELTAKIRAYDKEVERVCRQERPETERLRQVAGVGALTALTYVLVVEDPTRFPKSRSVASYLGLCPRLDESGGRGVGPELSITKAGHPLLRRLLVGAAQYVLGPFGPDCDLRRWGLDLAGKGGRNQKKRAVVAVARKLSVLLHRLWTTGEAYRPLREELAPQTA